MRRTMLSVGVALLGASVVLAADKPATCSQTSKCPKETPCCSQYGQCGVGAYCLGGCDPRSSFSLDACVPSPVCIDRDMKMGSTDKVVDVQDYLGDASKSEWVAQGTPLSSDDGLLLTMPPRTAGTVLSSTGYLWYGNVKARMKTSRGRGVVTGFIFMSDVKDEIDFEWVGADLEVTQTNYYFQGIPDYTHAGNITGTQNTFENWHDYEIRWTPDDITWLVDGKVGRVQKKSDTWNKTSNQWDFPQTPSRVQFSLWPGGADTNAKGTVDWAGGAIDWNSEDIKNYGYDFATVASVKIECYKTKSAPGTNSGKSYTIEDYKGLNTSVSNGDKPTVLKSLLGTGLDMDKDYAKSSTTQTMEVIPGLSGGGPGTNGQAAAHPEGNGGSGTDGNGPTPVGVAPKCTQKGFAQDCDNPTGGNANEGYKQERALGASAFAALIAVAGMLWL
ncbi:glycosyl hydrolase family 16 [Apiospora kogelbergensis]|uniref:Glycosyl hydrolase family 16 n=1 Tax=Apiospora kogelbergensis TaxID=1337665 RepID=A0AAW0QN72_9PEZI